MSKKKTTSKGKKMGYRAIIDLCLSNNITDRRFRAQVKRLEIDIKRTKRPSTGQIVDVISEKDAESVLASLLDVPTLRSTDITAEEAAEQLGIAKHSVMARCKTRKIGTIKRYPKSYEDLRKRSQKVFTLTKKEFEQIQKSTADVEVLNLIEE